MRRLLLLACSVVFFSCSTDRHDAPPLIRAAREGDAAAVRAIVAHGADPNAAYGALNWTPLMHAIHANRLATVTALLDAGADVNRTGDYETEPRTKQLNVTPLMMAAGYGYTPIVRTLLRRGADPGRVDGDGNRALDYALSGVLFHASFLGCQDDTVRALVTARAPLRLSEDARRWAKVKRCSSAIQLASLRGD